MNERLGRPLRVDRLVRLAPRKYAVRENTPYGKVPVLYVDGRPLSQSVAICRYLGAVHGLSSKDPWLAAVGDEVADSVHDLLPVAAQIVYAK
ncbi:Glutathione S-Transferase Sigma 7 [Hyalella azteca]|uniref:glutathione transferase n=1 Tax=Hyalella azteca TaxID=294128 RepID=A0A6A0GNJ4_HYAAZ|nr:Glutathione S-Transferase Sigma 7 [Hyalella azteca]